MQCAGASRITPLRIDAWRVVEAQHQVATRRLVDSDAEQQMLEQLIESAKPPERTRNRLHYLLFTPFRYPPLRHGSRFGARTERGIWYGSLELRTAFAEVAYYRLLFIEGTRADLGILETELTAFVARIETAAGIDLMATPFNRFTDVISSPSEYGAAQALGSEMRAANVGAFCYGSARDAQTGINVGVFDPAVFGRRAPRNLQPWHSVATRAAVEIVKRDYFGREAHRFAREQFLVEGRLPAPAL